MISKVFFENFVDFCTYSHYNNRMNVTKVILTNFRNYHAQTVEFCPSLNIIEGHNTAGKTNLIESVYLCGVGKSPRTTKDREMIRMGEDEAHVTLLVDKKHRSHRVDIHLMPGGKKIAVDGVSISRFSELMGVVNVVFFAPDELKIIKSDPQERRRFVNISLCQQSKPYYAALSNYNRVLDNRNAIIKEADSIADLEHLLPDWNMQMAEEGAKIILTRIHFLHHLQHIADPIHRAIAGPDCDLLLQYSQPDWSDYPSVYEHLMQQLTSNYKKELALRYTVSGPHRDDFDILSEQKSLRAYGSQGQQRTAALALKLAEISYFEEATGEKPILLLDDVLSELDASRRRALLQATDGIQTLLTCTEFTEENVSVGKRIHIQHGQAT